MHLLNLTLETPAANVALDEALLEACVAKQLPAGGVLRLWESPAPVVVLGRGTRLADEVNVDACQRDHIPLLRRVSGGMSIVAGQGCLMYAVVDHHPAGGGANIDVVHRHVLDKMVAALRQLDVPAQTAGTSDLAIRSAEGALLKVSGNSLRMTRSAFLYHGTLLYDFALPLVSRYLLEPPRSPSYRSGREHGAFITNLPVSRDALVQAIAEQWKASENLESWPCERTDALVATRYDTDSWNNIR